MGTHPIFESDFDCLTEEMGFHKLCRFMMFICFVSAARIPTYSDQNHLAMLNEQLVVKRAGITPEDEFAKYDTSEKGATARMRNALITGRGCSMFDKLSELLFLNNRC